jgi:hypothetical protein
VSTLAFALDKLLAMEDSPTELCRGLGSICWGADGTKDNMRKWYSSPFGQEQETG